MPPTPEPTIAEIERGVAHMTYIVGRYGERYRPILDSLTGHLEARRRKRPSPERSMPKRPIRVPDRSEITGSTLLHLTTAAALAFPDGSVSALALRNAASRSELEYVRIAGRVLTTLAWVDEFMERCRRPVRSAAKGLPSKGKAKQ